MVYTMYDVRYPMNPPETGSVGLNFSPSMIRKMKCEAGGSDFEERKRGGNSDNGIGFSCYFGLVDGTFARVSFTRARSINSFSQSGSFFFDKFYNSWIEDIKISSSYISLYSQVDQNYAIVNYLKNESRSSMHSVVYTSTKGLDFLVNDDILTFQCESNKLSVMNYRLQNAFLSFPSKLSKVPDLQSITFSLNKGEYTVKLQDVISNEEETNKAYFIIFGIFLSFLVAACFIGCVYVFRTGPKHPDLLDSSNNEDQSNDEQKKNNNQKQIALKQQREKELEKDLEKSYYKKMDNTQDDIANLV